MEHLSHHKAQVAVFKSKDSLKTFVTPAGATNTWEVQIKAAAAHIKRV
jgi:hypothetical protein